MVYRITLEPNARKFLLKLPEKTRQRVVVAFSEIKNDPYLGKKLEGEYKGYYSARVGPYRIIYSILQEIDLVVIVRIGQRQGVYR